MSVTFCFPYAPRETVRVDCPVCNGTGKEDDGPCLYCNGIGWDEESCPAAPFFEFNLSNVNARDFLQMLDPEHAYEDLCGTWPVERLDRLHSRAVTLLNTSGAHALTTAPHRDGIIFYSGRDLGHVTRTLRQFLELFATARRTGQQISFG